MVKEKTALIISAHAADFVWRCGGAIALHAKLGYEVSVVCLSYGERGESARLWKEGKSLDQVKSIRRKEAENAAHALNVDDIKFLDLGDYPLNLGQEAQDQVVDIIRAVQPKFMMSHSQYDPYNTDHMRTTDFTLYCKIKMGYKKIFKIFYLKLLLPLPQFQLSCLQYVYHILLI